MKTAVSGKETAVLQLTVTLTLNRMVSGFIYFVLKASGININQIAVTSNRKSPDRYYKLIVPIRQDGILEDFFCNLGNY